MRLHTDVLTRDDILNAAKGGTIAFDRLTEHGSRSHARAFEVKLTGSGTHTNSGRYGANTWEQAATWDEWGIFLGRLYEIDRNLLVGSAKNPIYEGWDDFHWQTGERFLPVAEGGITWVGQHKTRHAWKHDWMTRESACKCGAVRRFS